MPAIKCNNCGGTTNTALSEYDFRNMDAGAVRCYGKWVDGKWTKGCAYKTADKLYKILVDRLMKV